MLQDLFWNFVMFQAEDISEYLARLPRNHGKCGIELDEDTFRRAQDAIQEIHDKI